MTMKKEYDFSKGSRKKFHTPIEEMELPIYLDKNVREFYYSRAKEHGKDPSELINDILQKDMEIANSLN